MPFNSPSDVVSFHFICCEVYLVTSKRTWISLLGCHSWLLSDMKKYVQRFRRSGAAGRLVPYQQSPRCRFSCLLLLPHSAEQEQASLSIRLERWNEMALLVAALLPSNRCNFPNAASYACANESFWTESKDYELKPYDKSCMVRAYKFRWLRNEEAVQT